MAKQYGGWYDNPETGRNQRWWGEGVWTDGEEPGSGGGGGDSGGGTSYQEYQRPEVPAFEFNWDQAEKDALTELTPYYERLLEEANGDMDLAKARLLEDYETGNRYREENFATLQSRVEADYARGMKYKSFDAEEAIQRMTDDYMRGKAWREEDLAVAMAEYDRLEPEERNSLNEMMNKRGMLHSTIQEQEGGKLGQRQTARREAIQRAMERQEEVATLEKERGISDTEKGLSRYTEEAGIAKNRAIEDAMQDKTRGGETAETAYSRGTEDIEIQRPRVERELGEEKKEKALSMAQMDRSIAYDRWLAENWANLQ